MDLWQHKYAEGSLVKTKIVATVGPASASYEKLTELVLAGVDVFRLNFAHGTYEWFDQVVGWIRQVSAKLDQPIAILADLAGPKIRLGELPPEGIRCRQGARMEFVHHPEPGRLDQFTCTYESLIDDLRPGDRVLLADGSVSLRVIEQDSQAGVVVCEVVQPGLVRSRQGVNLPGAVLSTPSVTEKDQQDLTWALDHEIDYIGLSFVRSAEDIRNLKKRISMHPTKTPPWIVAKIEKPEAIANLEQIVIETDAVMVARGDLGVEADIFRVPALQKQIIRLCNEHRTPVITATQMLDSMQKNEIPTRAEASDVFNAVLDGTDAVMLSGETAAGDYPMGSRGDDESDCSRSGTDVGTPSRWNRFPEHANSRQGDHRGCDAGSGCRHEPSECRSDCRGNPWWQDRHGDFQATSTGSHPGANRPTGSGASHVFVLGCDGDLHGCRFHAPS